MSTTMTNVTTAGLNRSIREDEGKYGNGSHLNQFTTQIEGQGIRKAKVVGCRVKFGMIT